MSEPTGGRPYGGLSPDARRAERRRKLLDAGLELFATKGYAATTIADLCRTAGVAPAKFYEEFPTKEQLLIDLCEGLNNEVVAHIDDATDQAGADLEAAVLSGLAAFGHGMLDDPRRARLLYIEVVGVSPKVERRRQRLLSGYADRLIGYFGVLAPDVAAADPDPVRVRMAAVALVGATTAAMVEWLQQDDPPAIDELVDILGGIYVALATWLADDLRRR